MKRKPRPRDGRNWRGDIVEPEVAAAHDFAEAKRRGLKTLDTRSTYERYHDALKKLEEEFGK